MPSNETILGFKFIPGADILLNIRSLSSMTVDELAKAREEGGANEGPEENRDALLWNDSALNDSDQEDTGYLDYQDSILNFEYHGSGVQYLQNAGFPRYYPSLKHLIPVRRKAKRKKGTLGLDEAGLWSFITIGWLSKYILAAYRKKFSIDDIPQISPYDSCEYNVQRLELLWQNELAAKGPKDASFVRVALRFMRTRLIVAAIIFSISIIISFIGVTVVMRKLLEFAENPKAPYYEGILWALALSCYELLRSVCYSSVWVMNFRTATRIRAACLALMYKKLLRLNSLGDKTVGEMINIFSLDGQRMFELVLFIPLIISGPIVVILGAIYIWWILSPWALIGFSSFFLFYPLQYALSRLSGYFKRKSVGIIDQRLNKMSEILHCIKLIKMYTWEKLFSKNLNDVRERELSYIKKNAYCTSFSSSLSATVPYISAMLTFLAHIAAGHTLSASQAFSIVSLFLSSLRSNLLFSKKDIRDIFSFFVSFQHFKKVLLLNETSVYLSRPLNRSLAVSITDGTFERYSFGTSLHNENNCKENNVKKSKNESGRTLLPETLAQEYVQILTNVNFFVPKGKLIGICGEVGSGKTSLLNAVLGQMRMTKGKICRDGSCAFVAQQPWLINATLRQNIIFGEKFNSDRYFKSIYASCLNEDIATMPGGDETEIGERGINLSGGQKQRVSLARAFYAARDIYLLDDPLSQVDAQIRETLFSRYIQSGLNGKTVLLVTHNLDCLKKCHGIVVMKDGSVVERGTHSELMEANGEYRSMVDLWSSSKLTTAVKDPSTPVDENSECNKGLVNGVKDTLSSENSPGKILINEEKRQTGALKTHVLISYMSACGGAFISLFVVLLMLFNIGSTAFSNWWLALWLKAGNGTASILPTEDQIDTTTAHTIPASDGDVLSTDIDDPLIVSTTMSIVESTTVLLNNATTLILSGTSLAATDTSANDIDTTTPVIDEVRSFSLETNSSSFPLSAPLISVNDNNSFTTFYTVYAAIIGVILFSNILRGYFMTNVTLRAAKTLHNKLFQKMLHAPMLFFETTPIGRIQNLFSKDTEDIETKLPQSLELLLNHSWQIVFALFFISLVFPWFIIPLVCVALIYHFVGKIYRVSMRDLKRLEATTRSPIFSTVTTTVLGLDTIHAFNKENAFWQQFSTMFNLNSVCLFMMVVGARWLSVRLESLAAFIMLLTSMLVVATHGQVSAAMAGLALAYASSISSLFQYVTRLICEIEVKFLAVERINMYVADIVEEGRTGGKKVVPCDGWPEKGSIVFKSVSLRYRPELPLVLKDITFRIAPKEKIGIVGRSGSGKSSIVSALFRFVEVSSGQVFIDKVDTATVDLTALRSKISIIPQDPIILNGTVRYNLDPSGKIKDPELWLALDKAKLKSRIQSMDRGLDSMLSQNGDNLSLGERQLLCLARAICRKTNIVVLDEATSGVDHETETIVLDAVKSQLSNCTVLTIAHRLETITSSDKILVMDNGQVCEFGPPTELLSNPNSMFSKLISSSNRFHDQRKD